MPEGTCKKCGKKYYGWALQQPQYRVCDCGGEIEVTEVTIKTEDGEVEFAKCANCSKELLGDVYRVDQGSFGDRPLDHFLEDFKFWRRIGYFCSIACCQPNREERR